MDISIHYLCAEDGYRMAMMLQKLLKDAGVENINIKDQKPGNFVERQDDELKLFVGAKPDKITIHLRPFFIGG